MRSTPAIFLIIMASLSLQSGLAARQIVVFGRNDVCVLDPVPVQGEVAAPPVGSQPGDPAKAAFLEAARRDFAGHAPFDAELALINPPAWGRVVSEETAGLVGIRSAFAHGFVFHLGLEHLLPNHRYILTLNGNPERPGNEYLADPVPGNARERYYDFFIATTDASGGYSADFAVFLHPGPYGIRFYVKDTSDFKIVLYHDFFDMTVL
jgi:hypothetical protein